MFRAASRWRRRSRSTPPALVYRGEAALPGCPEAAADLVARAGLSVRFVGERERLRLDAETLGQALLYVHPGGGELEDAWPVMRRYREVLRAWVAGGGHYLGFCLGAYLAGHGPGLGLLPGDTDQYVTSRRATVTHTGPAVVTVVWRGVDREVYFQDGPRIELDRRGRRTADVLARYPNGEVAAAVLPRGRGRVGVVGVHPEATADWFEDSGLPLPGRPTTDLGLDVVHTLVDRRPSDLRESE